MSSKEDDVSSLLTSAASPTAGQKTTEHSKRLRLVRESTHSTGSDPRCRNYCKNEKSSSTGLSESTESDLADIAPSVIPAYPNSVLRSSNS